MEEILKRIRRLI